MAEMNSITIAWIVRGRGAQVEQILCRLRLEIHFCHRTDQPRHQHNGNQKQPHHLALHRRSPLWHACRQTLSLKALMVAYT
jgi:hypothetical protein